MGLQCAENGIVAQRHGKNWPTNNKHKKARTKRAFSDSTPFFTAHFEEALPKKALQGRVIDLMRSLLM